MARRAALIALRLVIPDAAVCVTGGSVAGMAIATTDPSTGELVKEFTPHTPAEIDAKLAAATHAFAGYRLTAFAERAAWMRTAAGLLEAEAADTAQLMTTDMGKTVKAAQAEVL